MLVLCSFYDGNNMEICNNLMRDAMTSDQVHYSAFAVFMNLNVTQFNIISLELQVQSKWPRRIPMNTSRLMSQTVDDMSQKGSDMPCSNKHESSES